MDVKLVVAVIAGSVALLSAFGTIASSIWIAGRTNSNARAIKNLEFENEQRRAADLRQKEISAFSEPLSRAAYDLQSRIYNVLRGGVLGFLTHGNDRERSYVVENTVFLIAQYLCWSELVRREIQFIDLGRNEETRQLQRLQDNIYGIWGTSNFPSTFRIFAGEQRAIGEALIQSGHRGPECMGYGAFLKAFERGKDPLIDALREDAASLAMNVQTVAPRLTAIQHALIDLLGLIDPDYLRFPKTRRSKV